jgi:hypothetical protein
VPRAIYGPRHRPDRLLPVPDRGVPCSSESRTCVGGARHRCAADRFGTLLRGINPGLRDRPRRDPGRKHTRRRSCARKALHGRDASGGPPSPRRIIASSGSGHADESESAAKCADVRGQAGRRQQGPRRAEGRVYCVDDRFCNATGSIGGSPLPCRTLERLVLLNPVSTPQQVFGTDAMIILRELPADDVKARATKRRSDCGQPRVGPRGPLR